MEKFEYKVLWNKRAGLLAVSWFDGELNIGPEITSELLSPYGKNGWEVVVSMQSFGGLTDKIILKRRLAHDLRA